MGANTATEKDLLPQGDKPPQDAQDYKDELNRITKYITDLDAQTRKECDAYDKTCLNYIKVLEAAEAASKKMTTHAEADAEIAALKERYKKVKTVSEEWVKKVDTLMK